jgi:hypothetical protein
MACRRSPRLRDVLVAGVLAVLAAGSTAHAEEPAGAEAKARAEAKRLFQEGSERYDRADFSGAIEQFRHAYDVWPDPLMIFAMGQAQRLKGDCRAALECYSRFTREVEPSPVRREAEAHVAALRTTCPSVTETGASHAQPAQVAQVAPVAPAPAVRVGAPGPLTAEARKVVSPAAPDDARRAATLSRAAPDGARRAAKVTVVLTVGGTLFAASGLGTYLWNTSRLDRWRGEDAWLSSDAARTSPGTEVTNRQETNDALSRSISRYDHLALGLLFTGGAALVSSAVVYLMDRTER